MLLTFERLGHHTEPSCAPYLATTTLEKLTKHSVTDVRQFREIIAGVRRLG
jgi:hypothetical protein